jgi:hypothetical protein
MAFTRLPQTRIDVFDAYTEAKTGQAKKVAEVTTDGRRGQVQVLDPAFAGVLKDAFERPQHVFTRGITAGGLSMDGTPRTLPAWSTEAIEHVVKNELKVHQLRAELAKR